MDGVLLGLLLVSAFSALNMGGSGLAASFSTTLGAGVVRRRLAVLLFGVMVLCGAWLFGKNVVKTLGAGIIGSGLSPEAALSVLFSATLALYLANLLKVPQSTSWVTVAALVAVGLSAGDLKVQTLLYRLLPAWVGLPLLSFFATRLLLRPFYPLRPGNLGLVERWTRKERALRRLTVLSACYVAFAIGSNNVANVVGPLSGAGVVNQDLGIVLVAPLFGLGALLFPAPSENMGKGIVPFGAFTAVLTNLVTATVLLVASGLGIPQSLVHINTAAIAAVSLAKEGSWEMVPAKKFGFIAMLWLVTPVLAFVLTFVACRALYG